MKTRGVLVARGGSMQLQLISNPQKSVQLAWADHTVAGTWRAMQASGATMVMVRSRDDGFSMIRRAELQRFAAVQPHARLGELPLHAVLVASPQSTIRQLEAQLASASGVEAVVMTHAHQLVAVVARAVASRESMNPHRVSTTSKLPVAA